MNELKFVVKLCDFGLVFFVVDCDIILYLVSRFYRVFEISEWFFFFINICIWK